MSLKRGKETHKPVLTGSFIQTSMSFWHVARNVLLCLFVIKLLSNKLLSSRVCVCLQLFLSFQVFLLYKMWTENVAQESWIKPLLNLFWKLLVIACHLYLYMFIKKLFCSGWVCFGKLYFVMCIYMGTSLQVTSFFFLVWILRIQFWILLPILSLVFTNELFF